MLRSAMPSLVGAGAVPNETRACWAVLQQMQLGFDAVDRPVVPPELPAMARDLEYVDLWKEVLKAQAFNFVLADHSLVQLRLDPSGREWMSFAFYECPHLTARFDDFCREVAPGGSRVAKQELRDLYREYVPTAPLRSNPIPVRYDLDYDAFDCGRHPAAHVHFGHNTQVRIATERCWRPLSFVAFIVRQFYAKEWQRFYAINPSHKVFRMVRQSLPAMPEEYLGGLAELECRLS